jgi:hypothetical protein
MASIMLLATTLTACGSVSVPFLGHREPDMTPAHDSADNMVRLDAAIRSGCESVRNIEKPSVSAATANQPQRWIAHTCTGDIQYDVVMVPSDHGPILKVLPVAVMVNKPMNPHFIPARPEQDGQPADDPAAPQPASGAKPVN